MAIHNEFCVSNGVSYNILIIPFNFLLTRSKKNVVTLPTQIYKLVICHCRKEHSSLEHGGFLHLLLASIYFTRQPAFTYPFTLIPRACFGIKFGPISLNFSKSIKFSFILTNQESILHQIFSSILQDLYI